MKPTTVVIDYYSFTVDAPRLSELKGEDAAWYVYETIQSFTDIATRTEGYFGNWRKEGGRRPYMVARVSPSGIRVMWGYALPHILIEIPGQGCESLRSDLLTIMARWQDRTTRIDLAVDIETDTAPRDFCASGYSARFKTTAYHDTATGQTYYVGSMNSDRYARVYRYHAPHPRHHMLRIEHVCRRKQAKLLAGDILAQGARSLAAAYGRDVYDWQHTDWGLDNDIGVVISKHVAERPACNTVAWLYRQVVPAMARMLAEGNLDLDDWLNAVKEAKNAKFT